MNQDDEKKGESFSSEPLEPKSPDLEGQDTSMDPESMTLGDWVEAENSRPTLPDETSDGLDDMDEEVRRQAEEPPSDKAERL